MGRRHGEVVLDHIAFSRSDIASLLAFTPDTLSRISSRLKSVGLFQSLAAGVSRSWNLERLARICPSDFVRGEADAETVHLPQAVLVDDKHA